MSSIRLVLGIETSCDDTSVALVSHDGGVCAVLSAHQDLVHAPFGGIVPEIASRNHTLQVLPLIERCFERAQVTWEQIDGLAVTNRPGLLGSLLVGVVTAKSLALCFDKPFLGVNHLESHLLAPFLRDQEFSPPSEFGFPYLALAVSGGHTQLYAARKLGHYEVLGWTLDDAAGEAFDKFAKMVGLGFPGGVAVDRNAQKGDPQRYVFPRALLIDGSLNFSFSGLKSAALRLISGLSSEEVTENLASLCASFQEAVVDSLIVKLDEALEQTQMQTVVLTGGVACNSRLREKAESWAQKKGVNLVIPPPRYCTDNAAMVAYTGLQRMARGEFSTQEMGPHARVEGQDCGAVR